MNDPTRAGPRPQQSPCHAAVWALVLSSMISTPVLSAPTDISSSPITSTNAAQVKPNIMLLMDTSGSMGWSHMPDEVESQVGFSAVGYKAAQCNVLYYNRAQTYALPKNADGSLFPVPSFTNSRYDAFKTPASPLVDLSSRFRAYDDDTLRFSGDRDTEQRAYYYYKTGGTVPIAQYNSSPCLDADPAGMVNTDGTFASSDGGVWHRALVSSNSGIGNTDERTNFAVWYSYYRTRILLIKSAASLAFTPLTDSFRVGFITVRPKDDPTTGGPINPDKYLPINDFTPVQRGLWFDKLFAQRPVGSSPTREGLARVGRHYAGKHDGINEGMTGDPVQFSCQQNFTIMTTDGYWNAQEESTGLGGGFIGGPVDIGGRTLVGQRDGNLDSFSTNNPAPPPASDVNVTPRPIWDGTIDGLRTIRNKNNLYAYVPCGTYFNMTQTTLTRSTSQLQAQTVQTRQATTQNLQSTSQLLQSTTQMLKSTSQPMRQTEQNLRSTRQILATSMQRIKTTHQTTQTQTQIRRATNQNLRSTTQNLQGSSQSFMTHTHTEQSVFIPQQTTTQNLRSTTQALRSTSQLNQGTTQRLQSTQRNSYTQTSTGKNTSQTTSVTTRYLTHTEQQFATTSQRLQRTTQTRRTSSQASETTLRLQRSTSQRMLTTSQTTKSTYQENRCDARGENCVPAPAGSCVSGGGVTCEPRTTGPSLVPFGGCTDDPASNANSWRATTCNTVTQPAVPAPSCTFTPASGANSFTTTSCSTVTTGPMDVATCTDAPANNTNSYTATTCANFATGPTFVATCTPTDANSGSGYVARSCTFDNRGPTGVDTCTAQTGDNTNSYLTIGCTPNNPPDTPVQTCTPVTRDNTNSWTSTICTTVAPPEAAVASCTNSLATGGNSWTSTNCRNNNTPDTPADPATCTVTPPNSNNGYVATFCPTTVDSVPSGSCSRVTAGGGNSWTGVACPTITTSLPIVPYGSCNIAAAGPDTNWTATTCPVTVVGPTPYAATPCYAPFTAGNYSYACTSVVTTDVPVATCGNTSTVVGTDYVVTTCRDNNSALTPVASCTTAPADNTNSYTATVCPTLTTTDVPVASCTDAPADNTNSYTRTSCGSPNNTTNVPVASCTNSGPAAENSYTDTVCGTNNQSNVAVDSCTQLPATTPYWITTTCPPEIRDSGPTTVASCTLVAASAGNGHRRTDCLTIIDSTPVQAGTCVPDLPNGIDCSTTIIPASPVATCTRQTAGPSNNWTDITCGTNDQPDVPVVACAISGPTLQNSWTTTSCPAAITTGPDFVASCTEDVASGSNNYVSVSCPAPVVSGPVGVQTCGIVAGDNTNSYTTTTCGSADPTQPVSSCTDGPANSDNLWTSTTCRDNNSIAQPAPSCSLQTPQINNGWVSITCPAPIVTTDVAMASCADDPFPTPLNFFTTTSCRINRPAAVPDGSCVPVSADNTNSYTATTCPTLTTGPVGVSLCADQTGGGTNSWLTIVCTPNNTTDVGVASCNQAPADPNNGFQATACRRQITTDIGVATCSGGDPMAGNSYLTTTCRIAATDVPSGTCTIDGPTTVNGYRTTTCPVIDSGVIGAPSCSVSGPNGGNNWTTTSCPGTATTGPTPVASCTRATADGTNSWTALVCGTSTTAPVLVANCTDSPPNSYNGYVETRCVGVGGKQLSTTTYTRTQVFNVSGGVQAATGTDTTVVDGPNVSGTCYAPGSEPALAPNGPPTWTAGDTTTYPSCTAWPCTVDVNIGNPRSVNSLADVAQYYYVTDLRTAANEPRGADYYRDDVPGVGNGPEDDRVRWQHMTTFSIALGVNGTLRYRDDYKTAANGDFADIRSGASNWPLWPDPATDYVANPTLFNDPRSIDDFWHAAVNGRGTYFSAGNPTSVIAGLASALAGITSRVASSTGAGTSSLEPVAGDNFVYLANYTTQKWTGDVQAHEIDITTGAVQPTTIWSAQTLLDATVGAGCDNRRIMLFRAGATDNLASFSLGSRACDASGNPTGPADNGLNAAERAYFNSTNVQLLSQWPTMTDGSGATPDQRGDAPGANLVNFLRGQRGFENFAGGVANKLFRGRDHVLGDVVDGQPVYVRAPFGKYGDPGFAAFKTAQAGRTPMLYVAANDGMLHAFYAGTSALDTQGGKEAWAVIPSTMLPKLYKLADANYRNIHEYFVDGTPTVSDVYDGSNWKTVLVGGLNDGGRGYYALDVTNPTSPKGLWEFNWSDTCYDSSNAATAGADCHLGLTFGKPLISKLSDGRWVVMVTSGYNNVNAVPKVGDGVGYLYVLSALTGQILYKIPTGAGVSGTPSGLAQLNNYVEKAEIDNTTVRVYGTDVIGNIWRFDVNDNTPPSPGREATLVGVAKDNGGTPQPITTRPELTVVGGQPMLFVATGKLLGATDSADVQTQSVYGIIDPVVPTTAFADLRGSLAPLAMTQVGVGPGAYRTVRCTGTTVRCGSANGWVVDLPDTGERVNVEMKLRSQTLIIGSNVPLISACTAGGYSWLNYLNFRSGLAVIGSSNLSVSTSVANSLIVGLTVITLSRGGPPGSGVPAGLVTTSNAGVLTLDIPFAPTSPPVKRISWREVLAP